ncbi:hypothetical protein EI94DRAFT_1700717 [Lactarius quietus]|nr:hypothetical protein EI94DRAFT_1700717 [Lactarius quietus]
MATPGHGHIWLPATEAFTLVRSMVLVAEAAEEGSANGSDPGMCKIMGGVSHLYSQVMQGRWAGTGHFQSSSSADAVNSARREDDHSSIAEVHEYEASTLSCQVVEATLFNLN